jgi:ATP-dependent DNA ligase
MLSWVIQITVISIILIFLVHHLINFFKSTLTVPKIKDLVNTPNKNYENMYNIINTSSNNSNKENNYNLMDLIPKKEESMKDELKNFLKKQLNKSNNDGTNISALDSVSSLNSFSIL